MKGFFKQVRYGFVVRGKMFLSTMVAVIIGKRMAAGLAGVAFGLHKKSLCHESKNFFQRFAVVA